MLGQILGHEVPVEQLVQERFDVIRPRVAIVDVIGVLPHIGRRECFRVVLHRKISIRRLHCLKTISTVDEPRPAGTELGFRCFGELFDKVVIGPER